MDIPALHTPRLLLLPVTLADADAIQRAFPRWEIVRFLADEVPWPYPDDGALAFLRDRALPAMERGQQWHWTIRPKSDPGRVIGLMSLMDGQDNNRGFWLVPEWQGRGLMTEACAEATRYWFEVLQKPLMTVYKAIGNTASRRISERGGMRVVATQERGYVSGRLPSEVWEMTRDEWLARNGTR